MIDALLRTRAGDQRGVVMIEFVIAFVPVFVLFLGVVQLALLAAAQLVVQHAAIAGARSASVVLDDDPRFYAGAMRGELRREDGEDGPRLAAIRRAVHAPLAAVAPDPRVVRGLFDARAKAPSVERALGRSTDMRFVREGARYLPVAAALAFPIEPDGDAVAGSLFDLEDRVSVRVSYLLPCVVPIAAQLACDALHWNKSAQRLSAGAGAHPHVRRALRELRSAPDSPQQRAFARSALPVVVLFAEATMPLQRAPYCYASEGAGCGPSP